MVVLCGSSGVGKLIVVVLLERFYDLKSGSIFFDGYDIIFLDFIWLRGYVIGFIY